LIADPAEQSAVADGDNTSAPRGVSGTTGHEPPPQSAQSAQCRQRKHDVAPRALTPGAQPGAKDVRPLPPAIDRDRFLH